MIDWLRLIGCIIHLEIRVKFNITKLPSYCQPDCEYDIEVNQFPSIQIDEIIQEFLARTRRLLIVGEIDEITSTHICNYLQLFSLHKEPVYMYINTPGGCLASGYAIIDQMSMCRYPIYTIVRGQAHSMGAMIASFGTKGHRYATQNSSLMLHSVVIQDISSPLDQHMRMTKYLEEDYHNKVVALAKRMNLTAKQLTELMNNTKWMSPQKAIKIGLIDGIWTPRLENSINKRFGK